jgi:hypothetical protein
VPRPRYLDTGPAAIGDRASLRVGDIRQDVTLRVTNGAKVDVIRGSKSQVAPETLPKRFVFADRKRLVSLDDECAQQRTLWGLAQRLGLESGLGDFDRLGMTSSLGQPGRKGVKGAYAEHSEVFALGLEPIVPPVGQQVPAEEVERNVGIIRRDRRGHELARQCDAIPEVHRDGSSEFEALGSRDENRLHSPTVEAIHGRPKAREGPLLGQLGPQDIGDHRSPNRTISKR